MPDIDVRLVDVTKSFGPDAVAVDHISLDVYDGEFFSLLGPSGCGKTTTLRMIGGFEEPTSGVIELQGQDVTWLPPFKRNVNTVFQNYALFPHLTIYENVAFGLRRRKVSDAEVKKRVPEMLELVELRGFDKRKPGQISGGQAQRVALARALINRPAVLLLDEPLGALDLKLRKQMQVELKRIQQEVGITFIYVTHDQEEAMTMSDRVAVMNRGRYEQLGAPGGPVRAARDPVRGRVPGRQQPAARAGRGRRRRARAWSGSTAATVVRVPTARWRAGRASTSGVRPEKIRMLETDRPGARRLPTPCRAGSAAPCTRASAPSTRSSCPTAPCVVVYEQNIERARAAHPVAAGRGGRARAGHPTTHSRSTRPASSDASDAEMLGMAAPASTARLTTTHPPTRQEAAVPTDRPAHAHRTARCSRRPSRRRRALQIAAAAGRRRLPGRHDRRPRRRPGPAAPVTGGFKMATWIGYMDCDENGYSPSLEQFQADTGVTIDYQEAVDGNEEFFASHLQGPLSSGPEPPAGTSWCSRTG